MVDRPTIPKGRDMTLDDKLRLLEKLIPGATFPEHLDTDATLIEYTVPVVGYLYPSLRITLNFKEIGYTAEEWIDKRIAGCMPEKVTEEEINECNE